MRKGSICLAACAVMVLFIGAAAAQDFLSYEGRNAIRVGQGGERKTVDGIDFWMSGDPPRRYQLIGSLTDERHKSGIWGWTSMSNLDSDIAKDTKKVGGDAVILDSQQDQVTGVTHSVFGGSSGTVEASRFGNSVSGTFNSSSSGFGIDSAIKEHDSRYLVVKYLPDPLPGEAAADPTPQPALPPAPTVAQAPTPPAPAQDPPPEPKKQTGFIYIPAP